MLWRIEYFVEGKHLEKALSDAAGYALNMAPPQPVANAVKKGGKLVQAEEGTSKKQQLIAHLARHKGNVLNLSTMRAFWVGIGGNPTSVNSQLINQLMEEKILKRTKKPGAYTVL